MGRNPARTSGFDYQCLDSLNRGTNENEVPIQTRCKPRYFGALTHLGRRNTHRFKGIELLERFATRVARIPAAEAHAPGEVARRYVQAAAELPHVVVWPEPEHVPAEQAHVA